MLLESTSARTAKVEFSYQLLHAFVRCMLYPLGFLAASVSKVSVLTSLCNGLRQQQKLVDGRC